MRVVSVAMLRLVSRVANQVFGEPGVEVDGAYYRDMLYVHSCCSLVYRASGYVVFMFQQDNALAHRAREREAQQMLR